MPPDKQYIPEFVGTVTKYVFVESPDVTPQMLVTAAYEISEGVMIKETCFGLQITGMPGEVSEIITELRKLDPPHIFVKDRGYPPGDTRRCRANLGGARPGYYGHEFEIGLVRYISKGLEKLGTEDNKYNYNPENTLTEKKKLPAEELVKIINSEVS
ncbi:methanogenesis marker 6 protein [Methanoplanus endosymbiosus]|uniref:Methanogenesis marker 6 protein n=1 Tax=Methanoplanus endosymbiosus TaxID=33865 RepID=A0A9E7PM39_9EURY|nr:methanogenesis marker 6 protein [Methanoplanus endosymbiosus]UUX92720.1 methanogenesis marker 6 protein [Methanoplanus endosymbiosus]